jgi:hypothetical protein
VAESLLMNKSLKILGLGSKCTEECYMTLQDMAPNVKIEAETFIKLPPQDMVE